MAQEWRSAAHHLIGSLSPYGGCASTGTVYRICSSRISNSTRASDSEAQNLCLARWHSLSLSGNDDMRLLNARAARADFCCIESPGPFRLSGSQLNVREPDAMALFPVELLGTRPSRFGITIAAQSRSFSSGSQSLSVGVGSGAAPPGPSDVTGWNRSALPLLQCPEMIMARVSNNLPIEAFQNPSR